MSIAEGYGSYPALHRQIADLREQVARLTAVLTSLRELAAGHCTIQKVINELGPMSLWSKQGLEDHIRRETEKLLAEREG